MKRLTAKFAESVTAPGKYHDGDAGLYLYVQKRNGRIRKSYLQRITIHGRRVELGLGSTKWTKPSEAREKAQANRKIARTGGDPREGRATIPTFEAAADTVIRLHAATWKNSGKSEAQWRASLRDYVMPRLGRRRVDKITTADVLAVPRAAPVHKPEAVTTLRITAGEAGDTLELDASGERARIDPPAGLRVRWEVSPGLDVRWTPRPREYFTLADPYGEFEIKLAA